MISEDVIEAAIRDAISKDSSVEKLIQKIKQENGGTLFGFDWNKFLDPYFLSDTVFESFVNTETLKIFAESLKNSIKNTSRPNNIGAGIWSKYITSELQSFDNMLGAGSKIAKGIKTIPYLGIILDTGIGIYENIQNKSSTKEIIVDASVDIAFGLGSMGISAALTSMATGTALGSVVPGIGNVVGGMVGLGFYVLSDVLTINGKSVIDWTKEGVGWVVDRVVNGANWVGGKISSAWNSFISWLGF